MTIESPSGMTSENEKRKRLTVAAKKILRQINPQEQIFPADIQKLIEVSSGDMVLSAIIEFGQQLIDNGHGNLEEEIARSSLVDINIAPIQSVYDLESNIIPIADLQKDKTGILMGMVGTELLPVSNAPYIQGIALVIDNQGKEKYCSVGILENGNIFEVPTQNQQQ